MKSPKEKSTKQRNKTDLLTERIIDDGRRVIDLEVEALQSLVQCIDYGFATTVKKILSCRGKLVFCGMGKAGIVSQKVAGTFSSLGHPSFFMHAAEAGHGDLGMISQSDMVFFFSNSGNTAEITTIIPFIKEIGSFTVGITGNRYSYLYKNVDVPLWMGDHEEACGLGLSPTTSTTLMIALGDALAVSVLKQDRQFNEEKFAFNHPGGSLGKKLLRVKDAMRTGNEMVSVGEKSLLRDVVMAMTQTRIGSAVVVDKNKSVKGIFSDGDLRRVLERNPSSQSPLSSSDFMSQRIADIMTTHPRILKEDDYVMDALKLMSQKKIGEVPVVDRKGKLTGVICLKDLV